MCHVTLQDERKHHCLPTAKNMSNLWYFVMTLLWTKNGTETLHFEMQRVCNLHRHQMIDYICYSMPHLNLLIYNRQKVKHEDSGIVSNLTIFPPSTTTSASNYITIQWSLTPQRKPLWKNYTTRPPRNTNPVQHTGLSQHP